MRDVVKSLPTVDGSRADLSTHPYRLTAQIRMPERHRKTVGGQPSTSTIVGNSVHPRNLGTAALRNCPTPQLTAAGGTRGTTSCARRFGMPTHLGTRFVPSVDHTDASWPFLLDCGGGADLRTLGCWATCTRGTSPKRAEAEVQSVGRITARKEERPGEACQEKLGPGTSLEERTNEAPAREASYTSLKPRQPDCRGRLSTTTDQLDR